MLFYHSLYGFVLDLEFGCLYDCRTMRDSLLALAQRAAQRPLEEAQDILSGVADRHTRCKCYLKNGERSLRRLTDKL